MGYVKIKVLEKGTVHDLRRWMDYKLEEPKCWNKFCYGTYKKEDIHACYVEKDDSGLSYLTTLCDECIRKESNLGILINENHLMVETNRKK